MKLSHLKKMRVIISLVFLLATTIVFLDYRNLIPEKLISGIVYLQFVPSLLKFINLLSITILGFIVVTLLTFFFGRVYCSTVCPLGILQDLVSWISRKFKKKKNRHYQYAQPHNIQRYSLLGLSIVVFLF